MNSDSINASLLLILKLAEEAEVKSLTTTELVKYLYLLDYYHAQETSGQSFTGIEWKFLHFGPFSPTIPEALGYLVHSSQLDEKVFQSQAKDGYLYSLTNKFYLDTTDLVSRYVRLNLEKAIRDFKRDLSKLLNFVYFKTEPMIVALPNDTLDFSLCRKFDITAIKPLPMKPLNQSKVESLRERRRAAIAAKKEKLNKLVWSGLYDADYFDAMKIKDDPIYPLGESFKAIIEV